MNIDDYAKMVPCVRSGFCCKRSPCAFGKWDAEANQCAHLEVAAVTDNGAELHRCGIYEWILEQPGNEINPAFGTGCCSPMFNDLRERILDNLKPSN